MSPTPAARTRPRARRAHCQRIRAALPGDQPLIGADRNGFFITTNEFSIEGPEFNGAQIYAFDKAGARRTAR